MLLYPTTLVLAHNADHAAVHRHG